MNWARMRCCRKHPSPSEELDEGIQTVKLAASALKISPEMEQELLSAADFLRQDYEEGQSCWALKNQFRSFDLDFNGHVNNLRYLSHALETIPTEIRSGLYLESLFIKFTSEAMLNDTVSSLCVTGEESNTLTHKLVSPDGRIQYCALQTKWNEKSIFEHEPTEFK